MTTTQPSADRPEPLPGRWMKWAAVLGIWTFFVILNGSQLYLGMRAEGMQHDLWRVFAMQAVNWYGWALLTPLILWLGRRVPLERDRWARALVLHLLFCVALSAVKTVVDNVGFVYLRPFGPWTNPRPFADMFWGKLTSQIHLYVLIYGTILGVGYAFNYYVKFRERETRASQLEA